MPLFDLAPGGGVVAVLFDQILGADAAAIDTGATIAGGYRALRMYVIGRTSDAGANGLVGITLNGDSGANYDDQNVYGNNGSTISGSGHVAGTSTGTILHGSGGTSNYPGLWTIDIPGYAQTTFYKVGTMCAAIPDGSLTNDYGVAQGFGWRNTAAINRVAVTSNGANLKAGSRLLIYGMP